MPGLKLRNRYGPAPIGAFLKPSSPTFLTYAFGTIQPAPVAVVPKYAMKSGHGSLRTMRTRPASTTCTSRTRSLSVFAPEPLYRSNENFTSAAVTGSPLWNFAFFRMTNSYVRPSFESVNDSARHGV